MLTQRSDSVSEADYLRLEETSDIRHEYVAGVIYAMTGATLRHNIIAGNIYSLVRAHLKGSPCRAFMSDAKLRVAKQNAYYYPDVMVTCEPRLNRLTATDTVVEQPLLVVEVLSPTTEGIDRREKRFAYRTLTSLREYVLVNADQVQVEIHRRLSEVDWEITLLSAGDPVELKSIELATSLGQIYEESGVDMGLPSTSHA